MIAYSTRGEHKVTICVWLFLVVGSYLAVFCYDDVTDDDRNDRTFQPEELVVSETGENPRKSNYQQPKRRVRRAALSLPDNTSLKLDFYFSVSIDPLNNTFTSFNVELPFRFVLPTYDQLSTVYSSLGKLDNDLSDDRQQDDQEISNVIDYEFLEEQRANEQRRTIFRHLETLFKKFGFDGELCLQRAICELAEAPLGQHGLLGKLVHLIFSPSLLKLPERMEQLLTSHGNSNRVRRDATLQTELELLEKPVDDQYTHAYRTGKDNQCWARFSSCPISLFTLLGH